jgi:hypothetical protein
MTAITRAFKNDPLPFTASPNHSQFVRFDARWKIGHGGVVRNPLEPHLIMASPAPPEEPFQPGQIMPKKSAVSPSAQNHWLLQ